MKRFIYLFVSAFLTYTASGYPKANLLENFVNGLESTANGALSYVGLTRPRYKISYNLFTQKNLNDFQYVENMNQLKLSYFDPTKLSLFLIHGWGTNFETNDNLTIKNSALNYHDINVFIVDWTTTSTNKIYGLVRDAIKPIGSLVGKFINEMQNEYNLTGTSFLLVGHSLGAHVAGNAAAVVKNRIERIVGLDPAGPQFGEDNNDVLDKSDANYVEVIHTGGDAYGIIRPIGHVDYYVNGGIYQPNCPESIIIDTCSHRLANTYFAESLRDGPVFEGIQCDNVKDFEYGECKDNERSVMGQLTKDKKDFGTYYLRTNKKSPFALGANLTYDKNPDADYNILLHIKNIGKGELIADYTELYNLPRQWIGKAMTKVVNTVTSFF